MSLAVFLPNGRGRCRMVRLGVVFTVQEQEGSE